MRNKSHCRFVVSLLLIWALFTGCYSYIAKSGMSFYTGPEQECYQDLNCDCQTQKEQNYFESLICHTQSQLDDNFTYRLASDSDLRVEGFDPKDKDIALKAPLLLRFAWFSDVQFRQHELKLGSKIFSRSLDKVIASSQRNPAQEDFHWAVYLSQIEATNRLHRIEPIDFMIHTGDSIDTGSIEELYHFIYISDRLEIPWLNLIGNHDVSIFGNYVARLGYGRDPGVIFYPVGNLADFAWMHRDKRDISGFGRHFLPVPATSAHTPSVNTHKDKKLPPTFHHGFDLESDKACSDSPSPIPNYEECGYYAADLCFPNRNYNFPVRLIALNSAKEDWWGADGWIDPDQRRWLKGKLRREGGAINLLFVHHRPEEFDAETQGLLTDPTNGALVVFTGHTHKHHLQRHGGSNGGGYYELNTGSVLEFPQIGRLIELRGEPEGPVWLISRALWSSPMTVLEREMPSQESSGEALKECRDNRDEKRKNLAEAVRCGHYGAYQDYIRNQKKKWRFWDRPQPFDEAWAAANVIIPVSPPESVKKK
jgi:predicted phosphodiesterase